MNKFSFQTIVIVRELKFSLEVPHPIILTFWAIILKRKKKSVAITITKPTMIQPITLSEFGGIILIRVG